MTDGGIWVFAGPSLPTPLRPAGSDFVWRPPAMAGDGFIALAAAPRAVVLIDGVFDQYPAIRHKELLALIDAGVAVFGASSMGALRAAELHTLGMTGVGQIYRAYASGWLTGDDEVALLHGPAEMGWAALTVPLVNVRATLLCARRGGVVGAQAARGLLQQARNTFFKHRTWRELLDGVADLSVAERTRFAGWLPGGYVDLKRIDALEALTAAAGDFTARMAVTAEPPTAFTTQLQNQVQAGLKPDLAS